MPSLEFRGFTSSLNIAQLFKDQKKALSSISQTTVTLQSKESLTFGIRSGDPVFHYLLPVVCSYNCLCTTTYVNGLFLYKIMLYFVKIQECLNKELLTRVIIRLGMEEEPYSKCEAYHSHYSYIY